MKLEIKKLNTNINEKQILKNINLDVEEGDVVCILGPNGHGKSTILKSIMNHYSISKTGNILLDKKNITNLSPDQITRNGLYYCSQNPVEIHGLTQLDLYKSILNIKNNDKPLKVSDLFFTINKNLKKVGLDESVLNRYVNDGFSGGEKKKNEIMQMLLINPQIILLDEIDSGLDIDTFNVIVDILNEEKANNKTIIFITHNFELIQRLEPNKVILIANGEIIEAGDYNLAKTVFETGFNNYYKKHNLVKTTKKEILGSCGAKHGKHNNNK